MGRGPVRLVVSAAESGERLDRLLSARDLGWSRSTLQRWIEDGRVTVDGVPVAPSWRARAGARVVVEPAPPPPSDAEPEPIPLSILLEDTHLLVLDKPSGMVVHPGPGHRSGTLVNALLHHARVDPGSDPRRPGIVHRLDKDTSGVMVVAKTDAAREGLVALFRVHDIERRYLAIVVGAVPGALTVDAPIARHPVHRKRFSSTTGRGKPARTRVTVLERLHGTTLIECRLETGRTHQIRVHLADRGWPILGDPTYGRRSRDPRLLEVAQALGRQALHATVLGFRHPITGEPLRFEVPPPADFAEALARLRD